MHLTVGTAFTITIFTSTVSVMTHNKNKLVDISVVKSFGVFVIIGVLAGTAFASFMKTKTLVLFFSVVVYFFGAYLMMAQEKLKKIKPNSSITPRVFLGLFSGFVSGRIPEKEQNKKKIERDATCGAQAFASRRQANQLVYID